MQRHPFRVAVEQDDLSAVMDLLHDDVEFRSPVVHAPYRGKVAVAHLLGHAKATLKGLTYIDELQGERTVALVFTARVGDRDVEGLDHLTLDDDGRIVSLRVMLRPLSGLVETAQRMSERLEADPAPPGQA
jgi:hypothetical protein